MSTSKADTVDLGSKCALVLGVGGLGCPAALALSRAGIGKLMLCDDDLVDGSNLHRQILYEQRDIGTDKLVAAALALARDGYPPQRIELVRSRLLPDNARRLVSQADVVLEGADNFGTKFLAADACYLERRPVVHGAAVRWTATVWSVSEFGRPCYRCLFEDLPPAGAALNCAEAGVMGPVVGFAGALMAELALRVLAGDQPAYGTIFTFDGKRDALRAVPVTARVACALCGSSQTISDTEESRYIAAYCAA